MTIQEADKHFIHTYNRSVVFTKGEGMYLYDDQGKKYLDMGAGIAVSALGYSNEEFKQALKDQIDDLIHISNLYITKPAIKAAELISMFLVWTGYFLQTVEQRRSRAQLSWRESMLLIKIHRAKVK